MSGPGTGELRIEYIDCGPSSALVRHDKHGRKVGEMGKKPPSQAGPGGSRPMYLPAWSRPSHRVSA